MDEREVIARLTDLAESLEAMVDQVRSRQQEEGSRPALAVVRADDDGEEAS